MNKVLSVRMKTFAKPNSRYQRGEIFGFFYIFSVLLEGDEVEMQIKIQR